MSEGRVLLVDDDQELTDLLSDYLSHEQFTISVANSAEAALEMLERPSDFDLAVFDIMMPGMSGLELLQQLRPRVTLPVIMLTGRGGDIDRILGLEMGADDYLAKPCNPRELLARIRAVLRRSQLQAKPQNLDAAVLKEHGVMLDSSRREVRVEGELVEFTSAEFNVLQQLMSHAGKVISKATLTEKVLHRQLTAYDRAIDVHVSRVRQKLAAILPDTELIKTVRGEGYLFVRGE